MRPAGLALTLLAGGFGALGRVLASAFGPAADPAKEPTSTGRSRKHGMTVAAGKRAAKKRRNVLRARGHHRQAVR
jgi:hypothetical protein